MATATPLRALVVEDDPLFRSALVHLLESEGLNVQCAGTIAEALAALEPLPRCVVLDLNLPDGSGTAVLDRIRVGAIPVQVAVLSGTTDSHLLEEVQRLRPDAVFRKPPPWAQFLGWLHEAAGAM